MQGNALMNNNNGERARERAEAMQELAERARNGSFRRNASASEGFSAFTDLS